MIRARRRGSRCLRESPISHVRLTWLADQERRPSTPGRADFRGAHRGSYVQSARFSDKERRASPPSAESWGRRRAKTGGRRRQRTWM